MTNQPLPQPEPITLDEDPCCCNCGLEPEEGLDFNADEGATAVCIAWVRSELGELCPGCALDVEKQQKADEEAGVTDRFGQANVAERVVMETAYPDAPAELLEKVINETPIAPVLLEGAENTTILVDGTVLADKRFLTKSKKRGKRKS